MWVVEGNLRNIDCEGMSSTAFKKRRVTLKSWVESKELREGTIYESRVSLDDSSTAFGIQGIPPFLPPAKLYVLCPIEIMTWKQQVLVIQVNSSYLLKGEQPDMSAYFVNVLLLYII